MSFELTPGGRVPSTCIFRFLLRFVIRHCVANTCSTSLVPIPNASEPNAPCVDVWLSPQTTVVPGSVKPCSGPIICTIPWRLSPRPKYVRPNSLTLSSSVRHWVRESASSTNWPTFLKFFRGVVGTFCSPLRDQGFQSVKDKLT